MSTTNLRLLLSSETSRILNLSEHWQHILENSEIPDDASGKIRAHIGLSRLLVNDKLQQFESLLNTYESGSPDVPMKMTISDLEGFWDLVYLQVEDTLKKYHALQTLQENNWSEVTSCNDTVPRKRTPLASIANSSMPTRTTATKNYTEEARTRLAEAKRRIKQASAENTDVPSTSVIGLDVSQVTSGSKEDLENNTTENTTRDS